MGHRYKWYFTLGVSRGVKRKRNKKRKEVRRCESRKKIPVWIANRQGLGQKKYHSRRGKRDILGTIGSGNPEGTSKDVALVMFSKDKAGLEFLLFS